MKVLEQTDRRLTFRTSPVPSLVFAVICLLFGSIAIGVARGGAFADRDHPGATSTAGRVSYTLGGVLVTTGIALAIFVVGTITCTFDRDADTVTLLRKRLVGTRSETFALQDVDRAEIEEQRSNDPQSGGPTYRTVLVFTDGRRVPLGTIYASGRATQERKVAVIGAFLRE